MCACVRACVRVCVCACVGVRARVCVRVRICAYGCVRAYEMLNRFQEPSRCRTQVLGVNHNHND